MKNQLFPFLVSLLCSISIFAQEGQTSTPQWRPVYHFTPEKNWTNDPNGLIFIDGVYHLYNQQNPFENKWGHMSWGHATSTDLLHWKHLPIAIPETIDQDTTWRFSGCVVNDAHNSSGFCEKDGCLVAVYTADQPNLKKESQFVAYSNDGGMTYTNYVSNPVIDLQKKDFRDPNVFWSDESRQWVMVVALPRDHAVRFYGSKDLKHWDLLSEFGGQGFITAAWECPFMIRLPVNGNSKVQKWVLMTSAGGKQRGPYMQYFVGDFDGRTFKNDNPPTKVLTVDEGDCFYAAIPWNNLPASEKIYIGWMVPGPQETSPWKGQMSIPRDLDLEKTASGIRLIQNPTAVIKNKLAELSGGSLLEKKDLRISNQESSIDTGYATAGNAYWMQVEMVVEPGSRAGFKIAQKKGKDDKASAETVITYDAAKHQLYVDRSKSGPGKIKADRAVQTIDLENATNKLSLEILLDKSSLEIFINKGEKVLSTYVFPEDGSNALSAFASHGTAEIKSLTIYNLSKINIDRSLPGK
jgi:fructan beta-fructosidase